MGNILGDGLFDPNADSYGRYNASHGIPWLVSILEHHYIPVTLMTSGLVAATFPEQLCSHSVEREACITLTS